MNTIVLSDSMHYNKVLMALRECYIVIKNSDPLVAIFVGSQSFAPTSAMQAFVFLRTYKFFTLPYKNKFLTFNSIDAIIFYMEIYESAKYTIDFYYDKNGESDVYNLLKDLEKKSSKSKDARIQYRQLLLYIELLSKNGNNLPDDVIKHIEDEIWELRPGKNRVLYFFYKDNKYVLLHHFIKKTQKTPKREIERAKREMVDYINKRGE
jgi:phage-related protein